MRLETNIKSVVPRLAVALILISIACLPTSALGQIVGGGPFSTGARNFQTNLLTILAPIAVIGVMVIGVAAWFNRISWGWAAAAAGGLILVFGAPQIVSWIRSMAGV
jgi:type IV secretion system protein VirB2